MRKLLTLAILILCCAVSSNAQITSNIDVSKKLQTMDGFGAAVGFGCSSTDGSGECTVGPGLTTQECNLLYSRTAGIGLSLLRVKLEENNTFPYSANTTCAVNNGARIWLAPWSAPANLKTNGSIKNGGGLCNVGANPPCSGTITEYQTWATQMANYITTMQAAGVPIYALSIQNEPDISPSYESMIYTAAQFDAFLKVLCPTLNAAGLANVKVMLPEPSGNASMHYDLASTANADPPVNACIDIFAAHGYNVTTPAGLVPLNAGGNLKLLSGQQVWQTEDANLNTDSTGISDALSWSFKIHTNLAVGYSAWHYWQGVNVFGDGTGQGILTRPVGTIAARYYYIGQYSKFVRPGMQKIVASGSNCTTGNGVCIDAFYGYDPGTTGNPNNGSTEVVIVAQAQAGTTQALTINLAGANVNTVTPYLSDGGANQITAKTPITVNASGQFTYSLCADCIVTFVGNVIPALQTAPGWKRFPNSSLTGLDNLKPCPPNDFWSPLFPVPNLYAGQCGFIVSAFSSSIADDKRHEVIIWGGGHNDYGGNEIYGIDLLKPATSSNNPPIQLLTTPSSPNTFGGLDAERLITPTAPNSRHTGLSGLLYMPDFDQMFSTGGALNDNGNCGGAIDFSILSTQSHAITSITQSQSTITVVSGTLPAVNSFVFIYGVTPSGYVSNRKVITSGSGQFTYTTPGVNVTSISSTSTTITVISDLTPPVGQNVFITGNTNAAYNFPTTWTVATTSSSSFTITSSANPGAGSGGVATVLLGPGSGSPSMQWAPATSNCWMWTLDLSSIPTSGAAAPGPQEKNQSPATNTPVWVAANTTSNATTINETAYDPAKKLVYLFPNVQGSASGPYSWNPATPSVNPVLLGVNNSLQGNQPEAVVDPDDQYLIYGGGQTVSGDTCGIRYFSTAIGSTYTALSPPGCSPGPLPGCPNFANWPGNGGNKNGYWPGMIWDSIDKKVVIYPGAGGSTLYILDPKTWTCQTENYGTTQGVDKPADIPLNVTAGGAWVSGHFMRFPSLNLQALIQPLSGNSVDDLWLLKRRSAGVDITPTSTGTNQAWSVQQVFAQGDVPQCALPYIDGTVLAANTYQTDVKNRWPDGSLKIAIVSFIVPSFTNGVAFHVRFDTTPNCNNSGGLNVAQMLAAGYNFDAHIVLTGTASPNISARTMLTAATTPGCALSGTDIDGAISTNLCTYWLFGPVVTAIILEDRATRAYDVNTDAGTGNPLHPRFEAWFYPQGNQVRVGYDLENEWASATSTLSARTQTIATTTFTAGNTSPITVYSQATSFDSLPFTSIRHSYCINGTGKGNVNFCGPVSHIDHRWAYLAETKVFPHYDPGLQLSSTQINNAAIANGFNSTIFGGCTACYGGPNGGIGSYTTAMQGAGADPMHGTMTSWELVYLISQSDAVFATVLANSDFGGNLPYWQREADHNAGHGQTFDNSGVVGNVETKGRIVSVNARQQYNFLAPDEQAGHCPETAPFDWVNLPSVSLPMGKWGGIAPSDGTSHWPDVAYVSYLMTGQYDYYEQVIQQADFAFGWGTACVATGPNLANNRQGSQGYINMGQERGGAWGVRNLAWGAFVGLDGSPEKAYLEDKLYNNIALLEGMHNIPLDTPGSTAQTNSWNFGTRAPNANPSGRHFTTPGQSPLGTWWTNTSYPDNEPICGFSSSVGCTIPATANANFQSGMSGYVQGLLTDLGYSTGAALQFIMKRHIHKMLDPTTTPYNEGSYVFPTSTNTDQWIPTYAADLTYINPATNPTSWAFITGNNCPDIDENGAIETIAVLSYGVTYNMSDAGFTAADAYTALRNALTTCLNATGGSTAGYAKTSAKWALTPRGAATFTATVSPPVVANPTFSPVAGTYGSAQNVTISTTTAGATICWTSNGSNPTTNGAGICSNGTTYVGPVSVTVSETLKAIASLSGDTDSSITSSAYVITGAPVANPTFSPPAGSYSSIQNVAISTITPGATICWTSDSSNPTTNGAGVCTHGTTYSGTIPVATSLTLKAIGTLNGNADSAIVSAAYVISGQSAVQLSPSSLSYGYLLIGSVSASQTVTLTNTGTGPMTIVSIGLTGANPTNFAITNSTCGASLAQGLSCNVSVAFSPLAPIPLTANLTFTTNAPTSPNSAVLSGNGHVGLFLGNGSFSGTGAVTLHP